MFGRGTALVSLLILALNPFHLWYAQEAASYALAVFLGLLSSYYCYSYFLLTKDKKDLWCYLLLAALALYSNYFCAILLICLQFFVFLFSRERFRKKISVSLPFLTFLPWVPFFVTKVSLLKGSFWIPAPSLQSLGITVENFMLGYNGTRLLYQTAGILALALLLMVWRRLFQKPPEQKQLYFCLTLFFLPIFLSFALSKLFFSIYLDRGFLIFSPYFYMLLSWAILKIKPRALKQATATMLCILFLTGDALYFLNQMYMPNNMRHHTGAFLKKPFKPLVKFINKNLQEENDYVVLSYSAPLFPLIHYAKRSVKEINTFAFYAYDPDLRDTNLAKPFREIFKNCDRFFPIDTALATIKTNNGKVFFIGGTFQRDGRLDKNSRSVKDAFDKNLILMQDLDFDGLRLFIYKIPENR